MDVEFCNLSFTVTSRFKGTQKNILSNISGKFLPGQLCGILGPSGAGKTTLLHAVSGYKTDGIQGDLKVNGKIRNESEFRRRSCYITQEDLIPVLLTVEETMLIAANLKLSLSTSEKVKKSIVMDILSHLGLQDQLYTRTENLSGGQKKRLSIALELINNPPVFFLDEPTSGLDNVSAAHCIKVLKKLAGEGRTILCTIHQPPDSIFQMFDFIYVVANGLCIYQGTPGNVVPYLSSVGYECPVNYNPADYLIELTEKQEDVIKLSFAIQNGKLCQNKMTDSKTLSEMPTNENNELVQKEERPHHNWIKLKKTASNIKITYETSCWVQFWILLKRLLLQTSRNKTALLVQCLHMSVCSLSLGAVYFQNANDGEQLYNHFKFIAGVILFYGYTHLMVPVLLFPQEIKLVKKEHFNRWYGLGPYYAATTIAKLPTQIFLNTTYTLIVYLMSGLPLELWRFLFFVIIGNAVSFATEGIGLAIGATFNVMNGSCLGPSLTAPFLGLAIYGVDFAKDIPWFIEVLMKTSPLRCGLIALVLTCFGFKRPKLDCNNVYCFFDDPKVILRFLDIESDYRIGYEMLALCGSILFYRIIAYMSIRKRFST